jgi:ABC-2 type transport system ATP-binding protein
MAELGSGPRTDAPPAGSGVELIRARGLQKRFGGSAGSSAGISAGGASAGGIWAVRGIDLSVPAGQVLGFLGPNGAGKSTTMRMITGFLEPTEGSVSICGVDIARDPIAAKRSIGYLPEGAPAYPDMTVGEFLLFIAEARGYRGAERTRRVDAAIERVHLGSVRGQAIETLSKGYKRRTGLAQALLHDPRVLVLDEPTDGLDPNQKHEVRELIRQLGGERAVVLSTHILEEVEAVCTRAVIINLGRIVFDGTPAEMESRAPASVTRNRLDWVFRELTTADVPASSPSSREVLR